jgi:hypothetical protein
VCTNKYAFAVVLHGKNGLLLYMLRYGLSSYDASGIYLYLCKSQPVLEFLNNLMGARNRVGVGLPYRLARGGIFKLLRSPEIDSKESIPPNYVARRAGTTTLFLLGSKPP